jgi:ABC-type multidrug transport system fused ATPase/permease subunit
LIVLSATLLQAITSFSLTQLLSKAGQRLIAEMRRQVQRHVGLLSVAYYDENRTGTLVARIMTDVEGVRNLVGTGLVDFVGGLLTAPGLLFSAPSQRYGHAHCFRRGGRVCVFLQYGFKRIRPIFRERGKINAEVTGRLTESLGGVRVIKGYHAEEREAQVFRRRGPAAGQRDEVADHDQRARVGLDDSAGLVSALVMWLGGHLVLNNTWTVGSYFQYNMFLAFMIAPVFQIVNIGTQLTEAFAGLDRTNEIMSELEENQSPGRTVKMPPIQGNVKFENVEFAYSPTSRCCTASASWPNPGTVTALVGSSGSGKSTIISLLCAFHTPSKGRVVVDDVDLATWT